MGMGEDAPEEHGHLPAAEDWPRGFGEASWWPFVTATGATGLYVGAALYLVSRGSDAVPTIAGPGVFVASMALFLIGLYGWLYHAFVKAFWTGTEHDGTSLRWGMVLFLTTEMTTFGAGFVYYFFIRTGAWPPAGAELPHLLSSLILINTVILVLSSFTLHGAHIALHRGNRRWFVIGMAVTLLLGLIFLAGQALEYYEFVVGEGFSLTSGVYASAFFGLTGLHGLHVTLGAILIAVVFVRALFGQFTSERDTSVTTVSMYWHFVDAVWIFLVVVIYIGAAV